MEILKSLSQQLLTLDRAKSARPLLEDDIEECENASDIGLTRSLSSNKNGKKDHNFKVVVRVRPPLPREIDSCSGFTSITQISK